MRKPSAYFPLYGNDFFAAIAGHSDTLNQHDKRITRLEERRN